MLRGIFSLEALITARHLDILAKLLLTLGLITLYCDAQEIFTTVLTGGSFDQALLGRRIGGSHAWSFWTVLLLRPDPGTAILVRGIPSLRRRATGRRDPRPRSACGPTNFMVIVVTLQHDFLPSSDHPYAINVWGVATFVGSGGLFLALILLFLRYLPIMSIAEARRLATIAQRGRLRGV